jgi:hypothetical protein
MSGVASLVFTFCAVWQGQHSQTGLPAAWFWVAAAICFFVASFRVWSKEHETVIKLTSLSNAPQVVFDYTFPPKDGASFTEGDAGERLAHKMSEPITLLNLNTGFKPLRLRIEPLSSFQFQIVFDPVSVMNNAQVGVQATVLERGEPIDEPWRYAFVFALVRPPTDKMPEWNAVERHTIPILLTYENVQGRTFVNKSVVHIDHRSASVTIEPGRISEIFLERDNVLRSLARRALRFMAR